MRVRSSQLAGLCAGLVCLAGSVGFAQTVAKQLDEVSEMVQVMGAALAATSNSAEVIDFRALKALLPESLPDMKRIKASGEKTGIMGLTISFAEASYENTNNASIQVKISDMGGMGGLMMMAQAGWVATEIDRETDTGYEKTTTYSGCKAHEHYDNSEKTGDIQILAGNRFMVEIVGHNLSAKALKAVVEAIDLKQLAALNPAAQAIPGKMSPAQLAPVATPKPAGTPAPKGTPVLKGAPTAKPVKKAATAEGAATGEQNSDAPEPALKKTGTPSPTEKE